MGKFHFGHKVSMYKQGQRKAWHMPPSGKLSVGVWNIRFREKWIDEPPKNYVIKEFEQRLLITLYPCLLFEKRLTGNFFLGMDET
jgi:hypothetical protein